MAPNLYLNILSSDVRFVFVGAVELWWWLEVFWDNFFFNKSEKKSWHIEIELASFFLLWNHFFFVIVVFHCVGRSVGRSLEPLSTLRHRSSPSFLVTFCYLLLRHEEKSYEFINHRYGVISILKRKRMRGQGG